MIDAAFVKQHARIQLSDDDDLIGDYILTAYEALESFLDMKIYEDAAALESADPVAEHFIIENASIKIAAAQGAAFLYEYREMLPQDLGDLFEQVVGHYRRVGL